MGAHHVKTNLLPLMKYLIYGSIALSLIGIFIATPAQAAIALVGVNRTNNSQTVTISTSTAAGEFIVVFLGEGNGGTAFSSVHDNKGDTYTQVFATSSNSSKNNYTVWYSANVAAGVTSVSSTGPTAANVGIIAAHYTGLSTTPLDVFAATTTVVGSPWASKKVTTTNANELMVGGIFCWGNGGGTCTGTAPAATGNWTLEKNGTSTNGDADILMFEDQIVSSIQTNTSSTGTGATTDNLPWIATFEAAATAPPIPTADVTCYNSTILYGGITIY